MVAYNAVGRGAVWIDSSDTDPNHRAIQNSYDNNMDHRGSGSTDAFKEMLENRRTEGSEDEAHSMIGKWEMRFLVIPSNIPNDFASMGSSNELMEPKTSALRRQSASDPSFDTSRLVMHSAPYV